MKTRQLLLRLVVVSSLFVAAGPMGLGSAVRAKPAAPPVFDDFESGLPAGTDPNGVSIGFVTFKDPNSSVAISKRNISMKNMGVIFICGFLLLSAVIGVLYLLRKRFPTSLTEQQQNTVLGPFSFMITLYAFLLGFTVVNLWQTFDQADRTAAKEAETVGILYLLTDSFPGSQTARQTLIHYVESVAQDEWPARHQAVGVIPDADSDHAGAFVGGGSVRLGLPGRPAGGQAAAFAGSAMTE